MIVVAANGLNFMVKFEKFHSFSFVVGHPLDHNSMQMHIWIVSTASTTPALDLHLEDTRTIPPFLIRRLRLERGAFWRLGELLVLR